jgi:FlaA1/EpsC-like NDP-sugar epimerase
MKTLAIVGVAGSLGIAICRRIQAAAKGAYRVIGIDTDENGLAKIQRLYRVEARIGDLRDTLRIARLLADSGCEDVINCAARKHVGWCEQDPRTAIEVNVEAPRRLLEAMRHPHRFVQISSDKAAAPQNVYAMTKMLADHLILSHPAGRIVRGVNFYASHGSVLDVWAEQHRQGLPFTVVTENCARYFMRASDMVDLCLKALYSEERRLAPTRVDKIRIHDLLEAFKVVRDIPSGYPVEYFPLPSTEKVVEELDFTTTPQILEGSALTTVLRGVVAQELAA